MDYVSADKSDLKIMEDVKDAMETIDDLSQQFSFYKKYKSPDKLKQFITDFLNSALADIVRE